ncbi:hypothetical protein BS47DRAFT_468095 [Hydnum rufescens UP504]|uniref:GST N-terminal domain-containing protein n=1 Tax=Hydnum rufescens UP504 TaxID=1448309 RepID=A0A9P6E036_9AGAM|nr:hypothetical protein BS47DRAFT_468095 [Hydnum rufescens UP504]
MQPNNSRRIPKAVLYCFPTSVWCSVVYLALHEKGFGCDEIEIRTVDLLQGENLAPSYLRINPKATVPSLVVPLEKSLAPDCEVRFKAINDAKSIVEFLDKSRSAISKTHTTSSAPAPDPNFLITAANTPEELASPSKVRVKDFLANRQHVLEIHTASPGNAESGTELVHLSPKTISFLQNVLDINSKRLHLYREYSAHIPRSARFLYSLRGSVDCESPKYPRQTGEYHRGTLCAR